METTETVTMPKAILIKRPHNSTVIIRGGYSVVCSIEDRPDVVLKVPLPTEVYEQAMEIEKRVYYRLGKHTHLVEVVHIDDFGIYLKRAEPGCLRLYYKAGGNATPEERINWCRDVAEVLHYVHQKNVRHGDLSGRNLLIDGRSILLCDFSGSYIDNTRATIVAETGFRHPDEQEHLLPTIRAEIHALGSTIYEIVTGRKPFYEKTADQEHEVDKLMQEGKYPPVSDLPLGDVIAKCWKRDGYFNSAADVAEEITRSAPTYLAQKWPSLPFAKIPSGRSSSKDLSFREDSPSISLGKNLPNRFSGHVELTAN